MRTPGSLFPLTLAFRVASIIAFAVLTWNHFSSPYRELSFLGHHPHSFSDNDKHQPNPSKRALLFLEKETDNITKSTTHAISDNSSNTLTDLAGLDSCQKVREHLGFEDSCAFVQNHDQCRSGGLVEYADFFFCACKHAPLLGYALLALWTMALFYMLGNTAADYFCCSLEKLSNLLRLPATVAGVTLLPLGNGAPDVFASIAAFVGAGAGEVGLNSVLGGAMFVTTVVAGSVCLLVSGTSLRLDERSFIRDVSFFLITLAFLFLVLIYKTINLWGALGFVSIYIVYAIAVAASECRKRKGYKLSWHVLEPVEGRFEAFPALFTKECDNYASYNPLIDPESEHDPREMEETLPQWMWASNVAIFSRQSLPEKVETPPPLGGNCIHGTLLKFLNIVVEAPLILPRRLTIPIIEEDRWSKYFAVASVMLAPILLAWVGSSGNELSVHQSWYAYAVGAVIGLLFGLLAFFSTRPEHPPRRFLFPWVAGGFVMSIVWFYIIAKELVSALIGMGIIFEIDPAILGLTVLAWGNSIGDLMANLTLASNGGDGVQIALSGCYAGPMFNTLLGLGLSLVLACWRAYPSTFQIPKDGSLFYTLGFLITGLMWSLFMLPKQQMQPSKLLGLGLLVIYGFFLSLRMAYALGFIKLTTVF